MSTSPETVKELDVLLLISVTARKEGSWLSGRCFRQVISCNKLGGATKSGAKTRVKTLLEDWETVIRKSASTERTMSALCKDQDWANWLDAAQRLAESSTPDVLIDDIGCVVTMDHQSVQAMMHSIQHPSGTVRSTGGQE